MTTSTSQDALSHDHVAVVCDDGHKRIPIALFERVLLSGLDGVNRRTWRWYSEATQRWMTSSVDGVETHVEMRCPWCGRNVRRRWEPWAAYLDTVEAAGVMKLRLADLERRAYGSGRRYH